MLPGAQPGVPSHNPKVPNSSLGSANIAERKTVRLLILGNLTVFWFLDPQSEEDFIGPHAYMSNSKVQLARSSSHWFTTEVCPKGIFGLKNGPPPQSFEPLHCFSASDSVRQYSGKKLYWRL